MEIWDLYNKDKQKLNKTHQRGIPLEKGTFHMCVSIWVITSDHKLLLTLRCMDKYPYPNTWENTGGSALVHESKEEAAIRELKEETGISITASELMHIHTQFKKDSFMETFIVKKDIQLSQLTMQPGETAEAKLVTYAELEEMIKKEELALPISQRLNAYLPILLKHL